MSGVESPIADSRSAHAWPVCRPARWKANCRAADRSRSRSPRLRRGWWRPAPKAENNRTRRRGEPIRECPGLGSVDSALELTKPATPTSPGRPAKYVDHGLYSIFIELSREMPTRRAIGDGFRNVERNTASRELLLSLPLTRHRHQYAHGSRFPACRLRSLHLELIDEEKRHPGLEIIEHLLQGRLLELAADDQADEAAFGRRAVEVDLRRQDIASGFGNGGRHPLLEGSACNRGRPAVQKRRARGRIGP